MGAKANQRISLFESSKYLQEVGGILFSVCLGYKVATWSLIGKKGKTREDDGDSGKPLISFANAIAHA